MLKSGMLGLAAITASALAVGCVSQSTSVRRYAAESMFCDANELDITEVQQASSAGYTHYEVLGCGKKQNYVCQSSTKRIADAAAGLPDPDLRRCRREML